MRIIFGLGHPAHFHLFKYTIRRLQDEGNEVITVINDKEILSRLLDDAGLSYITLTRKSINDSLLDKVGKLIGAAGKVRRLIKEVRPDILVGCTNEIALASFGTGIPVLFFAEDDFRYTWMQGITVYPFVSRIVSPAPVNVGPFRYKKLSYNGFQKLAYLHPGYFKPDRTKVKLGSSRYFIIRLVGLNAYHDRGKKGMDERLLPELIKILSPHGDVFISSEKPVDPEYEKLRLPLNPSDIHHYLAYASIFISDSQSMTVEASLLGTPNIRISDFAGKVSVLEVLEKQYGLTIAFRPDEESEILGSVTDMVNDEKLKENHLLKRAAMLEGMIDVTDFTVNLIKETVKKKR